MENSRESIISGSGQRRQDREVVGLDRGRGGREAADRDRLLAVDGRGRRRDDGQGRARA